MFEDDYIHPASGRTYREGDPAQYFAQLAGTLASECEQFARTYRERLMGADYLAQQREWMTDPDRIARAMAHTIEALDKAYTAVTVDRDLYQYGLGRQDGEWQRKYGKLTDPEPRQRL